MGGAFSVFFLVREDGVESGRGEKDQKIRFVLR